MKKNKFIINQSNTKNRKKTKILPILAVAGLLGLGIQSFEAISLVEAKTKSTQSVSSSQTPLTVLNSISLGHEILDFNTAIAYNSQNTNNTLERILSSDLNKLVVKNKSEAEVLAEINLHIQNLNEDALKLAQTFRALEHTEKEKREKKATKLGLSPDSFLSCYDSITKYNLLHNLHTTLDRMTLVRLGVNEDVLKKVFDIFQGENLDFSFSTQKDVVEKTNHFLDNIKGDITTHISHGDAYNHTNPNAELGAIVATHLDGIEHILTGAEDTRSNREHLRFLINKTPVLLTLNVAPKPICQGLVQHIAANEAFCNILTTVKSCGYDLSSIFNQKPQNQNTGIQFEK